MIRLPRHLAVSLALLAGVAALPACNKGGEEELPPASGAGAAPAPVLPSVAAPAREEVAAPGSDRTTGTAVPVDRAEVAPTMSAIIESIAVDEGDLVKKGQVLFRMRTSDLALQVQQAQAAVKSASVGVSAAKVEFDRMQRLLDQNAVERAQYDRVKAQYDAAAAAADQARVALAQARRMMGDATVKAPIGGVVTAVLKNPGEMATMMPPTVVVVIEDQRTLEVKFRLPESSLATLKTGDVVQLDFEAVKATREATVARISPSVDPRTRTIEVTARLDNADGQLRSGMLAVVRLGEEDGPAAPGEAAAEAPAAKPAAAPAEGAE